jgi:hypothetical protein
MANFPNQYQFVTNFLVQNSGLQEKGVRAVAMDVAGVYRRCLYFMPEEQGIIVCPVHLREIRQVIGRKCDVKDAHPDPNAFCGRSSARRVSLRKVISGGFDFFLTREGMVLIGMGVFM